jgi:hypothetical protein
MSDSPTPAVDVDERTLEIGLEAAKGVLFAGVPLTELSPRELLSAAGFLNLELKDLQMRAQAAIEILVGPEPEEDPAAES